MHDFAHLKYVRANGEKKFQKMKKKCCEAMLCQVPKYSILIFFLFKYDTLWAWNIADWNGIQNGCIRRYACDYSTT